jgi:hypothetical protein
VGLMEAATKGLLEVRSETLLRGVSRTFEAAEAGTYGQFLGASYAEEGLAYGERGWLLHLRQESGRFRTNIAVANTWHAVAKLAVDLFASDGTLLATYPLEVPPTSVVHDLEPFVVRAGRADLGWGFARVRVTAGKGVLVLASVVDDRTNDATTVPLLR